jgi:hypothetical protein
MTNWKNNAECVFLHAQAADRKNGTDLLLMKTLPKQAGDQYSGYWEQVKSYMNKMICRSGQPQ